MDYSEIGSGTDSSIMKPNQKLVMLKLYNITTNILILRICMTSILRLEDEISKKNLTDSFHSIQVALSKKESLLI